MPAVLNSNTKLVFDAMGREIPAGAILVHADEEGDQPAPEVGGGRGHGVTASLTAQESGNSKASAIAALPLNQALHKMASLTDTAALNALATDSRLKIKNLANKRLAIVTTP